MLLGVFVAMFLLNWKLALIVLVVVPLHRAADGVISRSGMLVTGTADSAQDQLP